MTLSGANLTLLSRCHLDIIKLDRHLVAQITPECPRPEWLVGLSAVLLATQVSVIGEGVETEAQATALRESGVAMAQGFYSFAAPSRLRN